MRRLLITLGLALLLPCVVLAQETPEAQATGLHTKLKMTMKMGFGGESTEGAGMLGQPMTYNAEMYFAGERVRMDMNVMGMNMAMIIDKAHEEMWMLQDMNKQAMHMDLSIYTDPLGAQSGFMSPTGMSIPFEQYQYILGTMDGYSYEDIEPMELLGEECKGMKFSVDLGKIMGSLDGAEPAAEGVASGMGGMLAGLGLSGTMDGKLYFSEQYQLPLLMVMQLKEESMGMDMSFGWAVNQISEWVPDEAKFAIPEGYEVVEMDEVVGEMEAGQAETTKRTAHPPMGGKGNH